MLRSKLLTGGEELALSQASSFMVDGSDMMGSRLQWRSEACRMMQENTAVVVDAFVTSDFVFAW